jgi:hypothetical protein
MEGKKIKFKKSKVILVHATKTCRGSEETVPLILDLGTRHKGERSASRFGYFTLGEWASDTHSTGWWMCSRTGLDTPCQEWTQTVKRPDCIPSTQCRLHDRLSENELGPDPDKLAGQLTYCHTKNAIGNTTGFVIDSARSQKANANLTVKAYTVEANPQVATGNVTSVTSLRRHPTA